MDIIEVAEIGMLLLGIYYGYAIFNGYTMIKSSRELFNRNRILLFLALSGVILFGLSFLLEVVSLLFLFLSLFLLLILFHFYIA